MQTQITARHFDASPELRTYAAERVERLERYYDGITDVRLVLDVATNGAGDKTAEMTVNVYRRQLAASESGRTHEDAIDRCVRTLRRQLKRYKAKLRSTDRNYHR